MEVLIKGKPKEIAALVLELQRRPEPEQRDYKRVSTALVGNAAEESEYLAARKEAFCAVQSREGSPP